MTCDITEADADATFPLTGDVACTEPTTVVVRAGARVEFRAAVPVHLSQYRFVVEDGAELVFSGVHFTFENSDAPADEVRERGDLKYLKYTVDKRQCHGAELAFSGVHFTFENSDAPADEVRRGVT
eukprot:TRINITY_DN6744_c0_g3_i4.p1 TRINITY_DN6744_c0_g3~~TRINITY_DN6744_c0_g3_i4.p1  ORF type:complete len:126 (-),score=34.18 TRINITY_DN6744_c0_g3_i4:705-1082(-)